MKLTITLATGVAAFGLALLPVQANDATTEKKPAAEQAEVKKAPVYIIQVAGKG